MTSNKVENSILINRIENEIINIYRNENLNCLRGVNENDYYNLNGKNILEWFSEIISKFNCTNNELLNYYKILNDILLCSDELIYFTAQLYLYKPFINNPIDDSFIHNDKIVYPNFQNIESKRYNIYTNCIFQIIYNFWDRIGDLIITFFPNKLKPNSVYFSNVIDIIPVEYQNNENYKWLKNFKENSYKELNAKRIDIVHYTSFDTNMRFNYTDSVSDYDSILLLQNKIKSITEYFKSHIKLSIKGFENTMYLIENIK